MKVSITARAIAIGASIAVLSGCAIQLPATTPSADDPSGGDPRPGAPLTADFDKSVVTACSATGSDTLDAIRDRGALNWAIGVSPPFGFKADDGSWSGVEADNARELAAVLGVEATIQDYDYGIMTAAIQTGKADIIGAQLFVTPERAEAIGFSDFYYLSGQLFYVLEESAYQTIDDLNQPGVRFVYGTGNAQKAIAEKYLPAATISDAPLRGQLLLYEFLASDQADVSMVEAAPMPVLLEQYSDPQLAAIGLNGRVSAETADDSEIIDPFEVAFGLPQGDEVFASCINAWVAEARDSGRMDERIQYWLSENKGR